MKCWHKWTKWTNPKSFYEMMAEKVDSFIGTYDPVTRFQFRTCEKCNITEKRYV